MVDDMFGKDFVPAALLSVVLDHDELELLFPLGVQSINLINEVFATDRADNSVAGCNERVDDVGSDKGVGTCEKRGGHCGLMIVRCLVQACVSNGFSVAEELQLEVCVSWGLRKGEDSLEQEAVAHFIMYRRLADGQCVDARGSALLRLDPAPSVVGGHEPWHRATHGLPIERRNACQHRLVSVPP